MRKIIFFILSIVASLLLRSQSLVLEYESSSLVNGDTITVEADASIDEVIAEISVVNSSGAEISTLAKRNVISELDDSRNAFCWGVCYSPTTDLGTVSVELAAGETNDTFSGHLYNIENNGGESLIQYTIYNESDENDSVSVYVNYIIESDDTYASLAEKNRIMFNLYPNPANEFCFLNVKETNYKIQIIDIIGKIVFESYETRNNVQMDISSLEAGIYNVLITKDELRKSTALIVQ